VQAGMTVLDVAKAHMADFHYSVMRELFPNLRLLYTDTDSFVYLVTTDRDLYQVLRENKKYFDFSDYLQTHPCFDLSNKKVIGKFKDEANGNIILEFVGLRSKLYSILFFNDLIETIKKAKGIKNNIIKNNLCFDDYLSVFNHADSIKYVTQYSIMSKHH